MLVARSSPECHLFIALNPCSCGESKLAPRHRLVSHDDGLGAVYEADCPGCGRPRRFEFALHDELPPPPPAFGGTAPSTIICPGQFLAHADRLAASVPANLATLPATERPRAAAALEEAVAALDEVLKAIPDGDELVPPEAIFSVAGGRLYDADPGRFRRARLEATRSAYKSLLRPT